MNFASNVSQPAEWRAFASIGYPLALVFALTLNFLTRVGHDEQRIVETVFLALVGLAAFARPSRPLAGILAGGPGGFCLLAFFLLGAASATMAYLPRYASLEVSMFLLLLTVALESSVQFARAGMPAILVTLQAVGWACALNAVRIVVNYIGSFILGTELEPHDLTPGFTNLRFFNHTQTVILPLLVLLICLTPKAARLRVFWLALASLWWMILYATTSRGTMVGLAAGCVFAAVLLKREAVPYLKVMAFTAIAGIGFYFVFLEIVPVLAGHEPFGAFGSALDRSAEDPTSKRDVIWTNAFHLILQHPWFGVGPMHFAHDAARFQWGAHPHDWVLQIAAEWGVPALLCLGCALYFGVRALAGTRARIALVDGGGLMLAALLLTGAAILVDGLVSGLIVMPQSQLAIALYLGLAFAWYRMVTPATPRPEPGTALLVANGALMLAAVAGIVWGVYPEMLNVMDNLPATPAIEALNRGRRWPRLWDIGFF